MFSPNSRAPTAFDKVIVRVLLPSNILLSMGIIENPETNVFSEISNASFSFFYDRRQNHKNQANMNEITKHNHHRTKEKRKKLNF